MWEVPGEYGRCPVKGLGEEDILTACNPCQHHPPVCKAANPPEFRVRILDLLGSMFAMEGTITEGSRCPHSVITGPATSPGFP